MLEKLVPLRRPPASSATRAPAPLAVAAPLAALARSARLARLALLALLPVLLIACDKPQNARLGADASRFLYVVHCDGRVDKLDTREQKVLSSFALSDRSSTTTETPAVPSLASSGGTLDGCLAQRVLVDAAGAAVSLIAPKDARLDSTGLQDFQIRTFALPQWKLTRTQPAGKWPEAPWLQRDAAGNWQVVADDPLLAAAPLDLSEFKGATQDIFAQLWQSSGEVSLLGLLFKDPGQFALAVADAKTRTLVQLADLPPTTSRFTHLAPGGGFVLVETASVSDPNRRTGALRLYDANGKAVADFSDERSRNMAFVALTPNGLAVYGDATGAYHFVSLGKTFGSATVTQWPLALPLAAPTPGTFFTAE